VVRDEFFWLGEINKATAVINTDQGLLDPALAPRIAAGLAKVLADAEAPGAPRPNRVIVFEPLLIAAAGPEATLLHAGRSSQDMHATFNAAILRDWILGIARDLATAQASLRAIAAEHVATIVPNYTNGVAAQPNSLAHQFLGHFAALQRDADRLRETYARVDRCPMGTTVLNGSGWPLDRERMAQALGFAATVDNAYDAAQLSPKDAMVELGQVITSIALHVGGFIEDLMPQYSQAQPWIVLQVGKDTTYVSSAMPQKRNPGLLNDTRRDASTAIGLAIAATLRLHNIPTGMPDAKDLQSNAPMRETITNVLNDFDKILNALVIDPDRALAELNADWTASQELADVLMRSYKLPFRIGHHVASKIVDHAKTPWPRTQHLPLRRSPTHLRRSRGKPPPPHGSRIPRHPRPRRHRQRPRHRRWAPTRRTHPHARERRTRPRRANRLDRGTPSRNRHGTRQARCGV